MFKRGFEASFVWIFALIVGAVIIFLAIYAAKQLVSSESSAYNSQIAAQLGAILSPVETNLESGKYYRLDLPDETRLSNKCFETGTFGRQEITASVRSGIGTQWADNGAPYSFSNKYVFSPSLMQSRMINLFVKPFDLPYKVGDVIMMYSSSYCFVDPPANVKDDVESLGLREVNVTTIRGDCPRGSTTVCFSGTGCNVSVVMDGNGRTGYVKKKGQTLYFTDSLLYGAIFSDPTFYDCQVNRLRKRAAELANLYADKSILLTSKGCTSGLNDDLQAYAVELGDKGRTITEIDSSSELLKQENEKLSCKLF